MRILLTIHHPLDPNTGAPGTTLRLAEALRRRGHEVALLGMDPVEHPVRARLNRVLFPGTVVRRVSGELRHRHIDVVDGSTGDLWLLLRTSVRRARKTVVVTRSHGLEHLGLAVTFEAAERGELHLTRRFRLYYGVIAPYQVARSLRIADGSLFLNEFERSWAVEHLGLPEEQTAVTRNGLSDHLLGVSLCATQRDTLPKVAVLGGFSWRKGADIAAQVLLEALTRWPELEVSWFGANPTAVYGSLLPGAESRVHVHAHYASDDLPSLLQKHEILLFLSRFEGFGKVVLEGMACGLVPIVSNSPGPKSIVGDSNSGVLIPRNDAQAALGALDDMLVHPSVREVARQRGYEVAQRYSWDSVGKEREELYARFLESKGGRGRAGVTDYRT